jgi:hypothetical protein
VTTLHEEQVETSGTRVLERPPAPPAPPREPFIRWIQWLGLFAVVALVVVGVVMLTETPVTDTDGSWQAVEDMRFARIGAVSLEGLAALEDQVNTGFMTLQDLAAAEDMLGYDGFQVAEDMRFERLAPPIEEGSGLVP